ncbi:hypothetical protein K9853_02430 [Lacticaseibacillus paracasei]|uniref:hypothetical protein n=1 Tax=Lacticaseibacillus paracasei TaxID=1597 RepID=UPI001EDD4366|nr:hypothetical protein [Lacticaseibacillus paracasei]MCG4283573.1 hypothetical protein [Lacticaseibacillus paracasei]
MTAAFSTLRGSLKLATHMTRTGQNQHREEMATFIAIQIVMLLASTPLEAYVTVTGAVTLLS